MKRFIAFAVYSPRFPFHCSQARFTYSKGWR